MNDCVIGSDFNVWFCLNACLEDIDQCPVFMEYLEELDLEQVGLNTSVEVACRRL